MAQGKTKKDARAKVTSAAKAEKAAGTEAVATAKKEAKVSHFFEIDGLQISADDIEARIKDAYRDEGHRVGNIKALDVYYNFGERRAYYVVNGKSEGKYVEF